MKAPLLTIVISAGVIVGCDNNGTTADRRSDTDTNTTATPTNTTPSDATARAPTTQPDATPGTGTGTGMGTGTAGTPGTDAGGQASPPQTPPSATATPGTDPTNTGVNQRDRAPNTPTADQQSQSGGNVDMAAEIRRRLTDTQMSVNAQNIKIMTEGGRVTLRGPVQTQEEKDAIGRIAEQVAGPGKVDNQLEVARNP